MFTPEAGGDFKNPANADPKKWIWYELGTKQYSEFPPKPEAEAQIRTTVQGQQELIAKLKALAAQDPISPEELYTHIQAGKSSWDWRIPNLLAARTFANLLGLDAYVHGRDNQPDEALADCATILRISSHLRDQPFLISQMIGVALMAIASRDVASLGPDAAFSEAAMTDYDRLATASLRRETMGKSFQSEMFSLKSVFDVLHGNLFKTPQEMGIGFGGPWLYLYSTPVAAFMRARDERMMLDTMTLVVKANRLPFYENAEQRDRCQKTLDSLSWDTPITTMGIPNLLRSEIQFAEAEAFLAQSRIALALNRYKRARNAYPDTLDALAPDFMAAVPVDPFSGKPMPYQHDQNGYLLRSVGQNGQDDALKSAEGKPDKDLRVVQGFKVGPCDDIVWCGEPRTLR